MRDQRKLRACELADELALEVYRVTGRFALEAGADMTAHIRRVVVSLVSAVVEGFAQSTRSDCIHFLKSSLSSCRELRHCVSRAHRLGCMGDQPHALLVDLCDETCIALGGLIRSQHS